jgi:hypothetical protein
LVKELPSNQKNYYPPYIEALPLINYCDIDTLLFGLFTVSVTVNSDKGILYERMVDMSKKTMKELVVFSIANEILSDGGYYSGAVYLGDNINKKKLSNLKMSTAARGNKFYGLIDLTLLGGSKEGLLFSDCQFYYSTGSVAGEVKYAEAFDKISIKEKSSNTMVIDGNDIQIIAGDVSPNKIISAIKSIKLGTPISGCSINQEGSH